MNVSSAGQDRPRSRITGKMPWARSRSSHQGNTRLVAGRRQHPCKPRVAGCSSVALG